MAHLARQYETAWSEYDNSRSCFCLYTSYDRLCWRGPCWHSRGVFRRESQRPFRTEFSISSGLEVARRIVIDDSRMPASLHLVRHWRFWCSRVVSGAHIQFVHEARRVYVPAYAAQAKIPVITFSLSSYWRDKLS